MHKVSAGSHPIKEILKTVKISALKILIFKNYMNK